MKKCTSCKKLLPFTSFPKRSASADGLNTRCFVCKREANRTEYQKHKSEYIARSKATLRRNRQDRAWNNAWRVWRRLGGAKRRTKLCTFTETLPFYYEAYEKTLTTGIKHVVDHIIPLNGEFVSGLHVPSNLQVITFSENSSKGRKVQIP